MSSAYPLSSRVPVSRKALMLSCAAAAVACVLAQPREAKAQTVPPSGAFEGSITSSTGTVTRTPTTNTQETITIGSSTATINWAPNDTQGTGNIDFLPQGNVATFINDPELTSDYTVLNRIVPTDPTRAIELNGSVIGLLQNPDGTSSTGGNIWFYSPGGILIGSSAVIDVGSLLLTTLDPGNNWSTSANGFSASFSQTEETAAGAIQILDGAQINALNEGSYIALVAPRIEQNGNVQVNGSAAYVAAEQLTMTMNQGLFDIQIDVGTDDVNGIVHTGTTGGPASTGEGDNHRIYMVAVPKNQILTLGLSGNVGFEPATVAGVENGHIILSAGRNVYEASGSLSFGPSTGTSASAHIRGNYSSDVTAVADDRAAVYSDEWGSASFAGNVSLEAPSVHFVASNGNTLSVGGDVTLSSDGGATGEVLVLAQSGGSIDIAGSAWLSALGLFDSTLSQGGSVYLSADGGSINVAGQIDVDVSGGGWGTDAESFSPDAQGGNVSFFAANGGSITAGSVYADASGYGSSNNGSGDQIAGGGTGGNISFHATSNGSITVTGDIFAIATGYGGDMYDGAIAGGAGYGGGVTMSVYDGTIDVAGDVTMWADGFGGSYFGEGVPAVAQGGLGQGGFVEIWSGGPGSITIGGSASLDAWGWGGDGQTGGDGYGGSAGVAAIDGTISLGPSTVITAYGFGGDGSSGFGGNGGYGRGGTAYVEALAYAGDIETPASQATITGGDVILDVSGYGGAGGAGNGDNIVAGAGGDGQGGYYQGENFSGGAFAASASPGASLTLQNTTLLSNGFGGAGGTGGTGQVGGAGGAGYGGSVQAGNYAGDGTNSASATYDMLTLSASGFGGDGGSGGAGDGDGGSAEGGAVFVNAKGTVTADAMSLLAQAFGGHGTNGGAARGGIAILQSFDGSTINVAGDALLDVSAVGGAASTGAAGDETGGDVEVATIGGGDILVSGTLQANAGGLASFTDDGLGGSIHANVLNVDAGTIDSTADLDVGTLIFSAAGDLSVANVDASDSASFTAGGLANFVGVVAAPTITVTSADINIALGASLGVYGVTNLVTLNAVSDGSPVIIGDDGSVVVAEGQYHLAEEGDIESDSVVFNAVSSGEAPPPDVLVYDFDIEGSETAGGGVASVTLNTAGSVFVEGDLNYINAGAGDTLAINAGEVIAVITDTGSIAMTDSLGSLSGSLELTAHDIWVADQALIDQLLVDPAFPGFEDALATNNGEVNPEGYVQAGRITVTMLASSFLVQNAGTSDAPAGISVGEGGLTIVNEGSEPATVILYGRQVRSDGTPVTGDAFADEVEVTGPVTTNSTVNNCPVGGCAPPPPSPPPPSPPPPPPPSPPPPPPPPPAPAPAVLSAESILGPVGLMESTTDPDAESEDDEEGADSESGTDASVRLIGSGPLQVDTIIDEPVTSGSDSPNGPN